VRVFRALDRESVLAASREWARRHRERYPEILKIALFGSYVRGDYAPGSDLDVLIVVKESPEKRWFMRSAAFDDLDLPVPADLFVYTEAEYDRMSRDNGWFARLSTELLWL
jgi:predicted nucleotidyltransferase